MLYDDAPAVSYEEYLPLFIEQFGRRPEDVFERFDRVASASASIAQVHRATLKTGEEVAVHFHLRV